MNTSLLVSLPGIFAPVPRSCLDSIMSIAQGSECPHTPQLCLYLFRKHFSLPNRRERPTQRKRRIHKQRQIDTERQRYKKPDREPKRHTEKQSETHRETFRDRQKEKRQEK